MRVCIEGNIGSGKSSVLSALETPETRVRQEPVGEWGELLDDYYADPAAWALPFNLKVLHSFHGISEGLVERSPGSCRYVFGQLGYNDNHLSPAAWEIFKEYHEILGWEPDAYVYVDTPVDVCYDRMRRRGRPCEARVTREYLGRIEFQYQNFLKFTRVPVHVIDGSRDLEGVVGDVRDLVASLTLTS